MLYPHQYDKAHPDEPPRTGWSHWETQQAYWCRGGFFHPIDRCPHFVEYEEEQIRECLQARVSIYQDGYIQCGVIDWKGCQRCYEEFMKKWEDE